MGLVVVTAWFAFLLLVSAKTIVITVHDSDNPSNPGAVFVPQRVTADRDDVITFNFTQGNHSTTQSTFSSPCVPAHMTNSTINGFDSSYRDSGNFSAITQLTFTVTNSSTPVWFFDYNTCGKGGVGAINTNESSTETMAGFVRNAIRLNGTRTTSTSSLSSPQYTPSTTQGRTSSGRAIVPDFHAVVPLLVIFTALSL